IVGGMVDTGAEVLELDHFNSLDTSFSLIKKRSCVFGNIDPSSVLCLGSKELVREKCREAILTAKKHKASFVLCPGCLVMANTPPENVRAMTDAAIEYGQYE
ncbi:MAG: uroporphyrinogen decarboxylase family protein, partial [Victivallales bacterium]